MPEPKDPKNPNPDEVPAQPVEEDPKVPPVDSPQ